MKQWPTTTQVLHDAGLYGDIARWSDLEAMKRGRYVDGGCNLLAMGKSLNAADWSPEHWSYIECYMRFLQRHVVKLTRCAFEVINKPLRYTGHPDQLLMLDGVRALIDIKTGGMSKVTGLQLASYEMALYSMGEDRVTRFGLQLNPDLPEGFKLHPFTDPREKDEFSILVQAHHIRNKYVEDDAKTYQ